MTIPESFLNFVCSTPGITKQEEEKILGCFNPVFVKKKAYFLKEGDVCKQIGYVAKGCLSYYRLLDNGRKNIIQFAFEDWWAGDLDSFLNRKPAAACWEALEDATLMCIGRDDFENMMTTSPAFHSGFTLKTQKAYYKTLERSSRDKSESAEERYLRLLDENPQIMKRVPHYDVAAYLGISPQSLSRIRQKIIGSH